jgi:hypothetical protein
MIHFFADHALVIALSQRPAKSRALRFFGALAD